jgi:diguanylate cyclase (GGDEF)-like protein
MSNILINSVAEATSHRDRDNLNQAIAALVLEYLQAAQLRWYVLQDDGTAPCCLQLGGAEGGSIDAPDVSILSRVRARETVSVATGADTTTAFPIESDQGVVGMLEVRTREPLTSRDEALVAGLLRILKNHLGLLDYGERDTLTGLLNRKTFERSFDKLRGRAKGQATPEAGPSWLGAIDVDKFKAINDGFGHLFGDEVLLLVARLMQETFRGADKLFRFGGEEFVVILDQATAEGARLAFERIRKRIEHHSFPQVGRITVSLGYTQIGLKEASAECMERADAALYFGKQNGRNCVHEYESLIALGKLTPKQTSHDIELF